MRRKGLVIGLLMMLAVVVSGFTYAFWANEVLVTSPNNRVDVIQIGSGEDVETTVALTPEVVGGILVPAAYAVEDETVGEVNFTFALAWTVDSEQNASLNGSVTTATLTVTPTIVVMNGEVNVTEDVKDYVLGLSVYTTTITLGQAIDNVTYTVTLAEPTFADYAKLAGAEITITFVFAVTNVVTAGE